MIPATRPIIIAETGLTNPAAGVIATSPATAPDAAPSVVGFPWSNHSATTHERAAVPAATWVVKKASVAISPAASALPALKPNQPNQRMEAPKMVIVKLCG